VVPAAVSLVLVVLSLGGLDRPFGTDYSGFNTAVWAAGGREVVADGWWDARLGASLDDGGDGRAATYAHHPPLTQVVASAGAVVAGDHRWVYRVAALAFAVGGIWCCWGWLGACRFHPGARTLGLLLAAGSQVFLTYGSMLNMETVWMPFLFGLLWAWQRAERHPGGGGAAALCGALALGGSLAAHQGILLAGLLGVTGLVRSRLERRRPWPHEVATLAGAVVGGLSFLAWVAWTNGGLGELIRIAGVRSEPIPWNDWAVVQGRYALVLLGVLGVGAVVAAGVLIRDRRDLLGAFASVLITTVVYAAAFRRGSMHLYWNATLVALVALGGALVAERVRAWSRPALAVLIVGSLVPFLGAARAADPAPDGFQTAVAEAGRRAEIVYSTRSFGRWAAYESSRPVRVVSSCEQVVELSAARPDALVVASATWVRDRGGPSAWDDVAPDAVTADDRAALVEASRLAAAACPTT
jgi:hypothetical protein